MHSNCAKENRLCRLKVMGLYRMHGHWYEATKGRCYSGVFLQNCLLRRNASCSQVRPRCEQGFHFETQEADGLGIKMYILNTALFVPMLVKKCDGGSYNVCRHRSNSPCSLKCISTRCDFKPLDKAVSQSKVLVHSLG